MWQDGNFYSGSLVEQSPVLDLYQVDFDGGHSCSLAASDLVLTIMIKTGQEVLVKDEQGTFHVALVRKVLEAGVKFEVEHVADSKVKR